MRLLVILGLVATLSVVSCKLHKTHHRETHPLQKYKDTKNKRGTGDYPYGLPSYGGQPFQSFPEASPGATSLAHDFPSYGGYGAIPGVAPLSFGSGLLGHSSQASPSFLTLGSGFAGLGAYGNLNQPLSLGQIGVQSADINLASLLNGPPGGQRSYSSSGLNLLTSDKSGPITYTGHSPSSTQMQQSYIPMYASSSPVGSSSYPSGFPSSSLGHGLSLTSLTSGSGVTYGSPSFSSPSSSSLSAVDSATAQAVTGGYVVAGPSAQASGSSASYSSYPVSALTSSSFPRNAVSIPTSSYSSASNSLGGSSSSGSPSSYNFNLPFSPSSSSLSISTSPSSSSVSSQLPKSSTGSFTMKPWSSLTSNSYGNAMRQLQGMVSYGRPSSFRSPGSSPGMPSFSSTSSSGSSYNLAVPNFPSNSNTDASSSADKPLSIPLTSYGTPAMSYSIPSTSYGSPSNSQYISSSNYNSASATGHHMTSSPSYASLSDPQALSTSYTSSSPVNSYGMGSSLSYQAHSAYKDSGSSYESSSPPIVTYFASADENSVTNYNPLRNTDSNSIEHFTASTYSNAPGDLSADYSSHSPRYLRYPGGRIVHANYMEAGDSVSSGNSGYDTISYSVPSRKWK